ncbi:MAG: Tic20 family protein [Cyanobacteria bacterium P01_F01_bin.150]
MTWRGSSTAMDRFFSCLVYALPLADAYRLDFAYGDILQTLNSIPGVSLLMIPLNLLFGLYASIVGQIPLGDFIAFILVFALVVRNERIRHFIRFNAMQAILVGIALSLFSILWQLILNIVPVLGNTMLGVTLINTIVLGGLAIIVYSIFQSALGKYAEIPTISDAVYMQVR